MNAPNAAVRRGPAPVSTNFLAAVSKAGSGLPSRVILHGTEGIGKSSFGAHAPSPIFLQSRGETGLETLIDSGLVSPTPHFPEMQSWEDVLAALVELRNGEHGFKTLVVDTLNGLEKLCHDYILRTDFGGNAGKFTAYGAGFKAAYPEWRRLFPLIDEIRSHRKMGIICLAHTKISNFKNPESDNYDRYTVDMSAECWGEAHKWADAVLFANYVVVVDQNRKGRGGRQRVIYTTRTAAHDAKNRLNLPETIAMGTNGAESWASFSAAIKAGRAAAANRKSLSDGNDETPTEGSETTENAA